ncbi:pyrroline-5-carboxylate reductase [Chitinophaga nivalis]|uniref:Pyrroline-5-carboxylate reductase n=1 Tax=Chitinophaga nivalis TaxID=2991709 RepID=A0ABT3IV31_9BACT|nr:pyrroline-5-carboxylate reductase [Chitinophaga nivalis]MCW3462495.1 pyrroline-5-carboxylate reductase [Chitinophaga nivalis]MCW3487814.1 pyrroline-5-carboxylate reductase [Chitinophaga nivalis]
MSAKKIAIIGGGNLGAAIAWGLLKSGFSAAGDITVTKRNTGTLSALREAGVHTLTDNAVAIQESEVIVVALKPYNVREILQEFKASFDPARHILISVVTGVSLGDLSQILPGVTIVRAMPNTAIAIQESITCICSKNATDEQIGYVKRMFDQLGATVSIDEKLMDAATVLGACGIAYALRYIRANIQGGIEIGFDAQTASLIAAQTVKGAAELLIREKRHPEEEIDKVTTPKGCTIAGLNEMEHQGFSSSLIKGITASYQKIAKD